VPSIIINVIFTYLSDVMILIAERLLRHFQRITYAEGQSFFI